VKKNVYLAIICGVASAVLVLGVTLLGRAWNRPVEDEAKGSVGRRIEAQADFLNNEWFKAEEKPYQSTGIVLEQRPLASGMYQTKILRDGDSVILLVLSGDVLSPSNRVEVGMYGFRQSPSSLRQFVHLVK
jgi:hypothetical protein